MDRVLEPELMLDEEQVRAYAYADFEQPHSHFIALLRRKLPALAASGYALDLGCGPGDISRRFARACPGWAVDAIDGSPSMLDLGRRMAAEDGLDSRIRFHRILIPAERMPRDDYALVFSNSLLHHLADPAILWSTVRRSARPGCAVFIMDLLRPGSRAEAEELVARYAAGEPEVLRTDFFNSLLAAHRPAEVRRQLERAGLDYLELEQVSDRHLIVWGVAV